MNKIISILFCMLLLSPPVMSDDRDVICFFPERVNFDEINKTCAKGDLIRTRSNMAELVCDWDKQIYKYVEDDKEWVTCVYHGHSRQLKLAE